MSMSIAIREAYVRADTFTRHLMAVDLQHEVFPDGHIRIVNHDQDVTVDGATYAPFAMQTQEPELGHEPDNKVKIRVDGVPGTFQFWIASAVKSTTSVRADLRPVVYNIKDSVVIDFIQPYQFMVTEAEYNMTACVLTLGHIAPTNMPFPGKRYSPASHPMLYK
jgi:hypothetical protein